MKVLFESPSSSLEVEIQNSIVIGRRAGCDVVLADPTISGRHLTLESQNEDLRFKDLESSNGTFLDEARTDSGILRPGSRLRIGETMISVVETAQTAAIPRIDTQPSREYEVLVSKEQHETPSLGESLDRILFQISMLLSDPPPLEEFLGRSLEILLDELPIATAAGVILFNIDSPRVAAKRERRRPFTFSRTVIERVRRSKKAIVLASGTGDADDLGASVIASRIETILAAPIIRRNECVGLLQLDADAIEFSDADLERVMVAASLLGAVIEGSNSRSRLRESERITAVLERFLSPDVVHRLKESGNILELGGDIRDVTVFFCDIRGFTTLSENLSAQEVVAIINRYFGRIVERVFANGGTIDKFIGDAVMAVFGAPYPAIDDARRACVAAIEARDASEEITRQLKTEMEIDAGIGFALTSGRVVSGNVGWEKRMEYTSIGDTVNCASRLSGIAGPGEILIDGETLRRAGALNAEERGNLQVKGRKEPLAVHRLLAIRAS